MCILEENSYSIFFPEIYAPFKFLFVWSFSSHSIWRRHHCRWRAANFDLCSALTPNAWVFVSGAVTTCFNDLGLLQLGLNIQPSACGANTTPRYRIGKLSIYSNDEPERVYHVLCMKVLGENQVQYQTIIVFYRIFNDPWYLVPKIATFDY